MMVDKSGVLPEENFWYGSACYALYTYASEELELIASNLKSEHESNLQSFLLRRLRKGAIYIGSGNFSVMEFSLASNPKSPATCFYISLLCSDKKQAICCLFSPPNAHLELFRTELQNFCVNLINKLKPSDTKSSINEEELNLWPKYAIDFLTRVVNVLGLNIVYFLQVALKPHNLEISTEMDPGLEADIRNFITAASVAELLSSKNKSSENPAQTVLIASNGIVQNLKCSSYCQEWAKLITKEPSSAASIKKGLESFKLKTIKDMNMLRRLLKQAETDHYSLYSACTFLRLSGNSNVLLCHAQQEGDSPKDVINILQQYLDGSSIK